MSDAQRHANLWNEMSVQRRTAILKKAGFTLPSIERNAKRPYAELPGGITASAVFVDTLEGREIERQSEVPAKRGNVSYTVRCNAAVGCFEKTVDLGGMSSYLEGAMLDHVRDMAGKGELHAEFFVKVVVK